MIWNNILIRGSLLLLYVSRFMVVIGMLLTIYMGVFQNFGEDFELKIEGRIVEDIGNLITVKPEYIDSIKPINIESVSFNASLNTVVPNRLIIISMLLVALLFYFVIVQVLYKLVLSAKEKEFFSIKNVLRLRALGFGFILITLSQNVYSRITKNLVNKYFESDIIRFDVNRISLIPDINSTLFLGLMILIIAQAFNQGLKLKEEQELTI
jgi:Protein of unknown function (DUF2975)